MNESKFSNPSLYIDKQKNFEIKGKKSCIKGRHFLTFPHIIHFIALILYYIIIIIVHRLQHFITHEADVPGATTSMEDYCFDATAAAAAEQSRRQSGAASDLVQGDGLSSGFLDAIITKVNRSPPHRFTDEISDDEIRQLCKAATDVFRMQPTLVRIHPPAVIVGDIHGQFSDLKKIFTTHGLPPEQQYVFLGDYVDRGPQSMETIILLFCYKVKYPSNFMLLRGNHECANINRVYGFYEEIDRRYPRPGARRLFDLFNQVFAWMPFVGLVGEKILCMHGGISDQIRSLDQLSNLLRPQTEPLLRSLEIDLLWADPSTSITGVAPNSRGAGVMFGADVVESVRNLLGIDYIVRAHQLVMDGVEYFADRHLITLFSAPRYTGKNNTGATLLIAPDLSHTITRFPPA